MNFIYSDNFMMADMFNHYFSYKKRLKFRRTYYLRGESFLDKKDIVPPYSKEADQRVAP